eukprot:CAMPEP_0197596176 /NCGR_PEP_ID=MMETSP1326-20131121/24508_1 /TAXON_ID=1155430 /ORGANISM="Genus nov. species nov., Strain RCC2288" /LENGTH=68 /DNA_ID=CAMNT_0043162637 /DNA_START=88 /DNA_END=295 /DNA_ORIENTATION=-
MTTLAVLTQQLARAAEMREQRREAAKGCTFRGGRRGGVVLVLEGFGSARRAVLSPALLLLTPTRAAAE